MTGGGHSSCLRLAPENTFTLIGLTALGIDALVLKFNVSLAATIVAVTLALISPKTAIDKVSWSIVLRRHQHLCRRHAEGGTVHYVAKGVSSLGMPLLVALLLCFHRSHRFGLCVLHCVPWRHHPPRRADPAAEAT